MTGERTNNSIAGEVVKFQSVIFRDSWFDYTAAGVALLAVGSTVAGTNQFAPSMVGSLLTGGLFTLTEDLRPRLQI